MRRDIINDDALRTAIDELLEGAPPALQSHLPALRVSLHKGLEGHESVRKARRRKGDPNWAQKKFAEGHALYRFFQSDLEDWEITGLFDDLKEIAGIAAGGGGMAGEAAASSAALFTAGTGSTA